MLKNDMQHQFWLTKKTVQRKLGGKEDQCIVSSDGELDLKLELFSSISGTSQDLYRVLDLYQERMSTLAMEETQLGRFLKEHGKLSQTSGKRMATAGKSISYSGQQRLAVRAPLIRLYSELETFRSRAVADTQATIQSMERERTEYRAALAWMKSITLDPENDRGMEKYRKAQQTVRSSKERFDRKSLDCLEKIDLLAAARCNLFSHVLMSYHKAMEVFANKTYQTFKLASKILENEPHYAFTILRDLTQAEKEPRMVEEKVEAEENIPEMRENAIDHDQLLFFQDDYTDVEEVEKAKDSKEGNSQSPTEPPVKDTETQSLIPLDEGSGASPLDLLGRVEGESLLDQKSGESNLLNMDFLSNDPSSSQLGDPLLDLLGDVAPQAPTSGKSVLSMLNSKFGILDSKLKQNSEAPATEPPMGNKSKSDKDKSSWFKLFSELDPLANPGAMPNSAFNSQST